VLAASEFGMNRRSGWYAAPEFDNATGRQFKPHLGRHSYWFFKTVEDEHATIEATWLRIADDIVEAYGSDGVRRVA
jgi:hypothetical protein